MVNNVINTISIGIFSSKCRLYNTAVFFNT